VSRDCGGEGGEEGGGLWSVVFPRGGIPGRRGSLSMGWSSGRSFWTKYCLLCTICGSAATILAGIFLVVAALFRYYTTSLLYFETVPTYVPAILVSHHKTRQSSPHCTAMLNSLSYISTALHLRRIDHRVLMQAEQEHHPRKPNDFE
jgi:hypothetical protein